ncbi:MAG: hypothetical protein Q7R50_05380, partial [Dehalococcoidales bacterium]|nr:hypothetical protein [Dehalococcoidales bacterium]
MKARIAAVSLVAALLAIVVRALPAAALEPHENPETAPLVFDGVAVLQKYSQALDYVMAENTSAMEQLQEQAVPANIPQELRNTVDSFLSSSNSLAGQLPLLKADIENAKTMLAQYRVEDARQSFPEIQARLSQAYSQLLVMDNAAADTGRWWNADAARPGTALRVAYDDVQTKLQGLRQFLDLLDNMNLSLTRQTEAILAITEGDLAKVEELKGLLAQEKASPEALAKVEELKELLTQEKASP